MLKCEYALLTLYSNIVFLFLILTEYTVLAFVKM